MSARVRIALWAGCALVAAFELPGSGAVLGQDLGRFWEHGAVLTPKTKLGCALGAHELEVASTVPIAREEPPSRELDR